MQGAEALTLWEQPGQVGVEIAPEEIQAYLDALADRGRSRNTVQMYRAKLRAFYDYLPERKAVTQKTLPAWRDALLEQGYYPNTVNTYLSAANGLLDYLGRRDLQLMGQLQNLPEVQPELTRAEYLRLLSTARALERERTYLMIKVFALTGLQVGALPQVTVEAVESGQLLRPAQGERCSGRIPGCLRQELLRYLGRRQIRDGSVFVTRNGRPLQRTQVTAEIQALGHDACVEESKCNPRCLRKLYLDTQAKIDDSVRLLAERSYEQLLDKEQLAVGWDNLQSGWEPPAGCSPREGRETEKSGGNTQSCEG